VTKPSPSYQSVFRVLQLKASPTRVLPAMTKSFEVHQELSVNQSPNLQNQAEQD